MVVFDRNIDTEHNERTAYGFLKPHIWSKMTISLFRQLFVAISCQYGKMTVVKVK